MNFKMIAPGERCVTLAAVILLVSCVKLYVAVPAPFVFEETTAIRAFKRELVAVTLLVVL